MPADLHQLICAHAAARHNAGQAVDRTQSLFYSGMIDSLGIQELAALLSREASAASSNLRAPTAADIVENDLDSADLIVAWMKGGA